jgi:hypothetical protein
MPGCKPDGQALCAFFPKEAPGGLLIVDDLEKLSGSEQEAVQRHLETHGAQLLASCHKMDGDGLPFDSKPMYVPLPPLNAIEAAELFLRRCQRPLLIEDLLPPHSFGGHSPKEVCPLGAAVKMLARPVQAFGGVPGKICAAVDKWVRRGSPCLEGDPAKLASSCKRVDGGKKGPTVVGGRWM